MSLDKALKNLKFDVRLQETNLKHGTYSKEDLQNHLKTIQDSAANAEALNLEDKDSDNDQH
ncbi:MAG: hypothetical protein LW875_08505 [Proteobacteria bacterium]|jgi:hypothetical protein|nr:hypothetical protein [Pseudomonadota bacterium]